jgi:two-component system sensor histidine kinase RegB
VYLNNEQVTIDWLVRFRWIAIIFQVLAYFFGVKLGYIENHSVVFYLSIVGLMGLINLASIWKRISIFNLVSFHIAIDLISFTLLIYFSGRMHNPFWPLIYLHAGIGAILIRPRRGLVFFILICMSMATIQISSQAYHFAIFYTMFPQWIILLSVWFLTRAMGLLIADQGLEISKLQQREMNSQKIKSIGSISAGILHELGTPLNTVRLKLDKIYNKNDKDLTIMNKALTQCEETISKVNSIQGESNQVVSFQDFSEFLNEYFQTKAQENIDISTSIDRDLKCNFSKTGLGIVLDVILNNAKESGASLLEVSASAKDNTVYIKVNDNGPGFDEFVLENFGAPYITTKGRGHGLGLFTSKMNLEGMGGRMGISNSGSGSVIEIELI